MLKDVQPEDYQQAVMDVCRNTEHLGPINFVFEMHRRVDEYQAGRAAENGRKEQQEQYQAMKKRSEDDPVPPEKVKEFLADFNKKMVEKELAPTENIPPSQRNSQDDQLGHNELADKIKEQLAFAEETLGEGADGAAMDHGWLNRTVGNLVLEYSERFPKGPFMKGFTEDFGTLSQRVMNPEN